MGSIVCRISNAGVAPGAEAVEFGCTGGGIPSKRLASSTACSLPYLLSINHLHNTLTRLNRRMIFWIRDVFAPVWAG